MNKLIKKLFIIIIFCILLTMLIPCKVKAAGSFSISKSSASLTTGETTTITITASGCAGQFNISSSNSSVASVSSSSVWLDDSSSSITVTSKAAGSATITVTASDVTDTDLNDITGSRTCSISVNDPAPTPQPEPTPEPTKPSNNTSNSSNTKPSNNTTTQTKSSNSKLATLQVAEGTISPEFSSSQKEYTISVPNEVTKLSISAIADSSKATVNITGNDELQIGENEIKITVKAEDESKTTYILTATRAPEELNINSLNIHYINENGEKITLTTNPLFSFNVYEYLLEKLPYTVNELIVEATSNKENANIEITGNKDLKEGKNEIIIKVTVLNEESGLEEQKTYTVTVEKEAEPVIETLTMMQKIKKWFSGAGITSWISENLNNIIMGMLFIATITFVGLTIYFAYDYKKYQGLLEKLAEYNKESLMERANVALNPEMINSSEFNSNIEEIEPTIEENKTIDTEVTDELVNQETCDEIEETVAKSKRGKRYKE